MKIYIVTLGWPDDGWTKGYFFNKEDAVECGEYHIKTDQVDRYDISEYELDNTNYNLLIKELEKEEEKSKLNPCILCGSKDLYLLNDNDRFSIERHYVFCNSCKTSFSSEYAEDSREDTVKWWNNIKC